MERTAPRAARRLGCVVLAAGGSRRLGTPKQLLRVRCTPLLVRAIEATSALPLMQPIVVVLGAHAPRLRALLRRRAVAARVVHNGRWTEGIASSLQAGARALPRGASALLVVLVDQPQVGEAELARLVRAWARRPAQPAAACYAGRVGVPAILPRSSWRALRALRGDVGARALLREAARVTAVPMPKAALDVDSLQDLENFRRSPSWRS